jgi:hypothetical protein
LILDLACARANIRCPELYLSDCILYEHDILGHLHQVRVEEVYKRLDDAELEVGSIHHFMRKSGLPLADLTTTSSFKLNHKCRRSSSGKQHLFSQCFHLNIRSRLFIL